MKKVLVALALLLAAPVHAERVLSGRLVREPRPGVYFVDHRMVVVTQ